MIYRNKVLAGSMICLVMAGFTQQSLAGEQKIRTSAKSRVETSVADPSTESRAAQWIDEAIRSGEFRGSEGTEKFLNRMNQNLERLAEQYQNSVKAVPVEHWVALLEKARKAAAEAGDLQNVTQLDHLLSLDRSELKATLGKLKLDELKKKQREGILQRIQESGGSVEKYLSVEKQKLLTRDYEGAKTWNRNFLFPMTSYFLKEYKQYAGWGHSGEAFLAIIGIPLISLPCDAIVLVVWAVGFPFALIF